MLGIALVTLIAGRAAACADNRQYFAARTATGATTALAVDGTELGPDTRLLADFPLAGQTQKPGATVNHVEFEVALDAQIPPGICLLRVAGPTGVSTAVPIGVDGLRQLPLAPEAQQLPVAFTARSMAAPSSPPPSPARRASAWSSKSRPSGWARI